jgi:hypothetical protein
MIVPPRPEVPEAQRARGRVWLRYEDVGQDGRLLCAATPQAIGAVFWRLLGPTLLGGLHAHGVVALLTRLSVEQGGGPLGVREPLEGEAHAALYHARDEAGEVERVLMRVWLELTGKRGRVWGAPPEGAGEPVVAGRVFAEHIFTRPFAAPEERKVRRLPAGAGLPEVPEESAVASAPAALARLPEGAEAISELCRDPALVAFGVDHTDSNQHVNSLAYPRLFVDAALRRLAELGCDTRLAVVEQHTGFRKPCFAGQRLAIASSAYRRGERLGVILQLGDLERPPGKEAHVYGRVELAAR